MKRKGSKPSRSAPRPDEVRKLRARLKEAEETLRAIREGEVDAIVVSGSRGEQVFSLTGAESVYRLIVETMKEAALTVTADGKILFCNQQFGRLLQMPMEQIVGRPLGEFVASDQRALVASLLATSQAEPVTDRVVFRGAAASPVPAHVSATVLNHPDGLSVCIVATDLSELEASTALLRQLRQQQEELQKNRDELESRVNERTAELTRAVEKLIAEVERRRVAEEALWQRSLQLRALASALSLAEERERRRLAEILHDDLQQLLVGARLQLGELQRAPRETATRTAGEVEDLINKALEVSRSLTREISPPILREGRLIPALRWLAGWFVEKHGLKVTVAAADDVTPESDDQKVQLFRAVQELLFNVVKHARAGTASVRVSHQCDQIQILVEDKGVGFDPAQVFAEGRTRGFGLFSIRERLDAMGGRMEIESAPGKGTRFTLIAPVSSKAGTGGGWPRSPSPSS